MSDGFRLRPPRLKETHVRDACLDLLRLHRYRPFRQNSGLLTTADGRKITVGERGLPDYIVMHGQHRSFLLEFKRPGGVLSNIQLMKIAELTNGWDLPVAVISSVEALSDWLAEHERLLPPAKAP